MLESVLRGQGSDIFPAAVLAMTGWRQQILLVGRIDVGASFAGLDCLLRGSLVLLRRGSFALAVSSERAGGDGWCMCDGRRGGSGG